MALGWKMINVVHNIKISRALSWTWIDLFALAFIIHLVAISSQSLDPLTFLISSFVFVCCLNLSNTTIQLTSFFLYCCCFFFGELKKYLKISRPFSLLLFTFWSRYYNDGWTLHDNFRGNFSLRVCGYTQVHADCVLTKL